MLKAYTGFPTNKVFSRIVKDSTTSCSQCYKPGFALTVQPHLQLKRFRGLRHYMALHKGWCWLQNELMSAHRWWSDVHMLMMGCYSRRSSQRQTWIFNDCPVFCLHCMDKTFIAHRSKYITKGEPRPGLLPNQYIIHTGHYQGLTARHQRAAGGETANSKSYQSTKAEVPKKRRTLSFKSAGVNRSTSRVFSFEWSWENKLFWPEIISEQKSVSCIPRWQRPWLNSTLNCLPLTTTADIIISSQ